MSFAPEDKKSSMNMPANVSKAANSISANSTWFNFSVQGGSFGVYQFSGVEELNKPYEFSIELVNTDDSVDLAALAGSSASLSILDKSGEVRQVHGLIRHMEQLHTSNMRTHYRCLLVPRLWFLGLGQDHRIFQDKSVVDIIGEILKEQGFTSEAVSFKCFYDYAPREYCVQYGESNLHFIQRLCEEEGIYFYFEHTADNHCLCFSDRESGPFISGERDVRFYPGSGNLPDSAVISHLNLNQTVNSNAASYREWNFERPKLNLEVKKRETDLKKAPVPDGMLLENYQYPHQYKLQAEGERYVQLQLLRQLTFSSSVEGESNISRLLPAHVFTVYNHSRKDMNATWFLIKVIHHGEQPQVLEHEAPDRGLRYKSTFVAIPEMTRFIPAIEHHKNLVLGDQTAIVTGPEGEEIYPDKYGRVKVQFFWDRLDQWNERTTCWIRVSQGWAGSQYGAMAIPRIGHEVIVSFLEGNPDRPIVTGRVYHELNMPPYALPEHKTRTVFKSMSTPGKENEMRGFNEFRIEDKAGQEEIYVHAEKDVNIHVKNDWKEHVLHDRHQTVDNFSYTRIKGEDHYIIEQPRKVELLSDDHLTVKGDSHAEYKTKWLAKTGQEIHFVAGDKVVIEAGSDLTVKGGGAFIRLTPAGVIISGGKVKINEGGSPSSGSGASMVLPDAAVGVDAAGRPIYPEIRKGSELATGAGPQAGGAFKKGPMPGGDKYWGRTPKECYSPASIGGKDAMTPKAKYAQLAKDLENARTDAASLTAGNGAMTDRWNSVLRNVKKLKGKPSLEQLKGVESIGNSYKYLEEGFTKTSTIQSKNNGPYTITHKEPRQLDDWLTPSKFLEDRASNAPIGRDCEDFALMKYTLLEQSGLAKPENMKIMILETTDPNQPMHAALLVDDPATGKKYVMDVKNQELGREFPGYDNSYKPVAYISHDKICEF